MTIPDYWSDLTPRQQLNDCIHKFAQINGTAYNTAWTLFEQRYAERHGVNLSILRYRNSLAAGQKQTIPAHLEAIGKLDAALDVALTMTMEA